MKLLTTRCIGILMIPITLLYGIHSAIAQQIITIAGTGSSSYSGDGSAATSAELAQPVSVARDGSGNIYISDQGNHRIRKINASTKVITTVAGSSTSGFSGDGGAATSAKLYYPAGIAVDGSGNIYIADKGNHRIRKVTAATGNISTIAGTGSAGFSGDGGAATSAQINNPVGVAVDGSGNIYIADQYNQRIRKITASTGNISTIAGTGSYGYSGDGSAATSATFQNPAAIALDGSGNIYIADMFNHAIRKITISTGNISTVAGTGTGGFSGDGGAATSAQLNYPSDISFGDSGNLYIAVQFSHRIRKVSASTGNISTVVAIGTAGFSGDWGPALSAKINYPTGILSDAGGNLYIADRENHRIRFVCNYSIKPSVSSPVNYCMGATASALSASGGSSYKWFSSPTGLSGSTTAPTPSTATAGTTTYYVAAVSPYGCEGPRDSIKVVVNSLPAAPTVSTPVTYCVGATATALSATGTGLLWYTAATGGTGSSTAPTPSTASAGTTTYYVSQTNSSTGCESARASISVVVNALPSIPTTSSSSITYCQGASASALTATGSSLKWYTTATGGTGSATAPTPSTATAGTFYYYVSQSNSCGESSRLMITVVVNAKPSAPTATTPITYCQGASASALSATGSSLKWYTSATGGTGSSTAPTPSTASAGTFYYYVSQTNTSGCESDRTMITVVINAKPSTPTATTPISYCVGATASALSATGTGLLWYTSASGGTGSSTAPTPSTASVGSTTYYVSQTNSTTGCESSRKAIVVNIINTPAAPTVSSPVNLCEGGTASALTASGTGLKWYTTASGGTGSSTAPTPSTASTGTTTYYVSSSNSCGESSRTAIVVNVNSKPSAPSVVSPVTYCQGETGISALSATGTSLKWYSSPTGGSGSSTPITPGTSVADTFKYYVSQTNASGCESDRAEITVIIKPAPDAPTVTSPVNYCVGATASPLSATGTGLLWFTSATGGTGSSTAPTPSTATAGSTTYYVSQTDTASCKSLRAAITVNVYNTPSAPTVTSPVNYCQYATASTLSASGSAGDTLKWYTSSTGGSPSYTAPTPGTSAPGMTTFYVSYTSRFGCGESGRSSISVTINAKPSAPTVSSSPIYYCKSSSASPLSATGSSLKWYTSASGGTGSTTAPTPSTSTAGTFKYYVSQTSSAGCESDRDSITVIIRNNPSTPTTASPIVYCVGATASPLSASGISGGSSTLWYTSATGGTGSATAPTPSTASSGSTTYYVSQKDSFGCESARASITVNVNTGLSAPGVSSPVSYCQGATATALTASGSGLLWYTSATGGTGSSTAPTPSTSTSGTTTYYVSQSSSCGESARSAIDVTINPSPAAPTFATDSLLLCQYESSSPLSATGSSLKWYTTATGGTGSSTAPTPSTSTVGTTIYYVSQTSSFGCESPRQSYKVSVNPAPSKPTVSSPIEYCSGYPSSALSATGSSLKWYSSATGGTGGTTAPAPSTASTGTTSYYVSQTNSYGCESAREVINVIIYATPTAPTVGTTVVLCLGDTSSPLVALGPGLKWYDTSVGGSPLPSAPTPSTATSGKYYYVTQTSSSGCESPRAPVLVNIDSMLSSPTVSSPVVYCQGESASPLSATGSSLHWYTEGSSTYSTTAPTPATASADTMKYYVCRVSAAGCEGNKDSITVFVNPLPTAPIVSSPIAYCYGATAVPLTATGSSLKWYTTATGGTGSSTAPTPSTTSVSTYYVSQTSAEACEGPRATINVQINPLPAAPTVSSPINYCFGESASPLSASGSSLKWYTTATGGTGSSTAPTPSTTTIGTSNYYVSQTSAEACEGPRALISVQVDTMLSVPTVSSPVVYCQGESASPLSATGGSLHWYAEGSSSYTSTAPTPSTTSADTLKYYVCRVSAEGCEGHKDSITVFINPLPTVPSVSSPISYCYGATTVPLTATGSSLKWYTSPTGGTASSTAPTPSGTDSSVYYVSQTSSWGCEGPRAKIKVQINPLPTAPTVSSPVHYCYGVSASPLSATGTGLKWYTTATGGTGSSSAPTPSTTSVGTTNYYVCQTSAEGCEGPRAFIAVEVDTLLGAPSVSSPEVYCQGESASSLIASGISLHWYKGSSTSYTTSSPVPNTSLADTIKYYVCQVTSAGCEGYKDSITVFVNPLPAAPTVSSPLSYCYGATTVPLTATGSSLKWYTSPTGGTGSSTAPTPSSTIDSSIYYVSQTTIAGCEGPRAKIKVLVNPLPYAPTVSSPVNYCKDDIASALTATGSSLKWYTSATGGTASTTAPVPSTSTVGSSNYYVSQTSSEGCEGPRALITVTINSLSSPPVVVSPLNICKDAVASPLSATGSSLKWYTTATGGTGSTSAPTPSTSTTGSTKYYVSQTNSYGCESFREAIEVIIRPIPSAPTVISPIGYCVGDIAAKLTAGGASLLWYSTATGGTGDTAAPTPSTTSVGSTDYYVSQVSSYGCESSRASLIVNVTNYPDVSISSSAPYFVYCKSDSVTLKAISSSTISAYEWYKDGILISGATSDSFRAYGNGFHKVVVYNEYGCKNDTSVYVFADTLPTPTLSPIDLLFCPNVNIVLFCKPASKKYSYEWYKDGSVVSGAGTDQLIINKAGTYYVRVRDTFGCVENTNMSVASTYPAIIRPKIIRLDPVLRLDKAFLTYQWYRNGKIIPGANAISYTMPSYGGTFWCMVTNENECTEYSDTVDSEKPNVIQDMQTGAKLKIYPNPTQSKVWIESDIAIDIRVTDITGKLIIEQKDASEIDLSDMADGIYLFIIRDKDGAMIGRERIHKRGM